MLKQEPAELALVRKGPTADRKDQLRRERNQGVLKLD
jgi:hypothetical protein